MNYFFYALFFFFPSLGLWAQYTGAASGGYGQGVSVSGFACNLFWGGEGSGADTAQWSSLGPVCNSLYQGDSSSGYHTGLHASSQNCIFFLGATGSGYNQELHASTFNCIFFKGSTGDGYTTRSAFDDAGACVTILSVEGSPLFAKWQNNRPYLHWETYREPNNEGFELWKSFDGINWQFLHWLPARGDEQTGFAYEYLDEQQPQSVQYYRYKQESNNGFESWSNVVVLSREEEQPKPKQQWLLYPNPSVQGQTIKLAAWHLQEAQQVQIQIYDLLGRKLYEQRQQFQAAERQDVSVPLQLLPGMYYLILQLEMDKKPVSLPLIIRE